MGVPYAEVIGDPIAHSKSPAIHKFWLDALQMDADYRACLVRPSELGDYFEARLRDEAWLGCNITMPHKLAALAHVHKHRDPSFPIEGVNLAIRKNGRLEGVNTDTNGILESLQAPVGSDFGAAIVVGAGGVLYPIMWSLSAFGFAPIWIVMRDSAKAPLVAADYRGVHARVLSFSDRLPPARLLVNATPLGMDGFPDFPLPLDSLDRDAIVFDLVYQPVETALLRQARASGRIAIDGLSMLIGQAAASFQGLFGRPPPREHDAELRELLTS